MIQYLKKEEGRLIELPHAEVGCWINISPPFSQAELAEVSQNYEVPLDFLTDSLDKDERSRYEREEDIRLIVVNTPILNDSVRELSLIHI